jgi:UDP:flavonoid glycosyltransferase YjiC (YdhE family)
LVPRIDDYGPGRPFVGFLSMDHKLRHRVGESGTGPDLESWLGAGSPPIYFGFGSMPVIDHDGVLSMISEAASALGQRALVCAGWSNFHQGSRALASPHIRLVSTLDHDAVLTRCGAAVHHGGAGTTAACALGGLPALVYSVLADQPFWGRRLEDLGVGAHLGYADLSARTLVSGLGRLLDEAVQARAARLGEVLRSEQPSVPRAADLIEAAAARMRC